MLSSLDVLTERSLTPAFVPSTPLQLLPPAPVEAVICPPAPTLFDDELPRDRADGNVQMDEMTEP